MKIGIFGGTFDPPHLAHSDKVDAAIEILRLDKVYVLPSKIKFFHENSKVAPEADRLEMTKLAFGHNPIIEVSDISLRDESLLYAVDVVDFYHQKHPDSQFWWIMGSDILSGLHLWKNAAKLATLCRFAVFQRMNGPLIEDALLTMPLHLTESLDVLRSKVMEDSSTAIRSMLAGGEDTSDHLHSQVLQYILDHNLYSEKETVV